MNKNLKKAFFWNTLGSFFSASSSFILLMFVTRICGDTTAGIFSLSFSIAQLMLTIGRYGMRAYQATDIKKEFSFGEYITSRIITCIAMILGSVLYVLINGYGDEKAVIVIMVCLIKLVDAIEDVYHGQLQQNNMMDVAGKLLTIRNFITIVVFVTVIIFSKNLIVTIFVTFILSVLCCFGLNIPKCKKIEKIKFSNNLKKIKLLFLRCFPLFIASFLSLYIYNAPKFAIDKYMDSKFQAFYGIIFMPSFVINMFSEFAFKPLLTTIALKVDEGNKKEFIKLVIKLNFFVLLITCFTLGAGFFLGIPVLSIFYNVDLSDYKAELLILLIGGGFGAGSYLLYNILTAMRQQKEVLFGYIFAALVASIISPIFVHYRGIMGASIAYLLSIIILYFSFIFIMFRGIRKMKGVKYESRNYNISKIK